MASGLTEKGAAYILGQAFQNLTEKTNLYIHLVNSTPTDATNTLSQLTNASNYSPAALTPGVTDFDVLTEGTGQAFVQVKDVVITASGGDITCTYAVLTDDNVTEGSREVYAFFDLAGSKTVSNGQTITLQDMQATITT